MVVGNSEGDPLYVRTTSSLPLATSVTNSTSSAVPVTVGSGTVSVTTSTSSPLFSVGLMYDTNGTLRPPCGISRTLANTGLTVADQHVVGTGSSGSMIVAGDTGILKQGSDNSVAVCGSGGVAFLQGATSASSITSLLNTTPLYNQYNASGYIRPMCDQYRHISVTTGAVTDSICSSSISTSSRDDSGDEKFERIDRPTDRLFSCSPP